MPEQLSPVMCFFRKDAYMRMNGFRVGSPCKEPQQPGRRGYTDHKTFVSNAEGVKEECNRLLDEYHRRSRASNEGSKVLGNGCFALTMVLALI